MANGAPTVSNGLVISGVTTSTSFSGSGANLTNLPAQATIANNADNRVITGGSGVNLNGEATLTYDGTSIFELQPSSATPARFIGDANRTGQGQHLAQFEGNWNGTLIGRMVVVTGEDTSNKDDGHLDFFTTPSGGSHTRRLRIDSSGNIGQGTATPSTPDGSNADNPINGRIFTLYGDSPAINLIHNTAGGGSAGSTDYAAINFGRNGSSTNPYRAVIGYKQVEDILHINSQNHIVFETGGNINTGERVRIDSDGRLLVNTSSGSISSAELFEVKSTSSGFSHFRNNHSGYAPIYIDNEYTNTAMAPLITITDGGGNRAGLLLDPNSVFDITGQGAVTFSTGGTVGNATERLRINSSGQVTKPNQPLFVAQKSAAISGSGTVVFNTVLHNVGSHYNSSNGRFTAPIAGFYWFCIKINAYKRIDFFLRRNGANSPNTHREIAQFNTSNQDGWYSHNLIRIFELAANDHVTVDVTSIHQNSDPGEWITFQGYLLQ